MYIKKIDCGNIPGLFILNFDRLRHADVYDLELSFIDMLEIMYKYILLIIYYNFYVICLP